MDLMARLKQRRFSCRPVREAGLLVAAIGCLFLPLPGRTAQTPAPLHTTASPSKPQFTLFDPGQEKVVDYEKYGQFTEVGTPKYRYLIRDREGLGRAVGEGIYPNVTALLKDPAYQKAQYAGKLEGSLWDFVNTDDPQINFFKW